MARAKLTRVLTTTVAAVAIGAAGVGGWFAFAQDLPLQEAIGAPPYGEAGRSPSDPLAVAELGGAKENYARITSLRGVAALRMLTRDELLALSENGASRLRLGVSRFAAGKALVLVVQLPDEASARLAADRLRELQHGYGFRSVDGAPRGVDAGVVAADVAAEPGGRAHYRRGDIVVRVEFRGPRPQAAEARFFELLAAQTQAVRPDA